MGKAKLFGLAFAGGAIVSHVTQLDFLTKLDLLKGFLGVWPHLAAITVFAIAWHVARLRSKTPRAGDASKVRAAFGKAALILLAVLCVNWIVELPEDFSWLTTWRWGVATGIYLAYHLCLGQSMD